MKRIVLLLIVIWTTNLVAQTGPGGVGNASNNVIWLDAENLGLANGNPVSSWTDISGNSNDADQLTAVQQPTYRTSQINSRASVEFDGVNDFLQFNSNISAGAITTFLVYNRYVSGGGILGLFNTQNHFSLTDNNVFTYIDNSGTRHRIAKLNNSYSITAFTTDNNPASGPLNLYSSNFSASFTRAGYRSFTRSIMGAYLTGGGTGVAGFAPVRIAEVIVFNEQLIFARRRIVSAYLGGKYNLTSETSIYGFNATHGNGIIGIGQEADGSHTTAQGSGIFTLSNPSGLGNGEYLLIGHDNGGLGLSSSTPNGIINRLTQVYRADETGTVGTIDLVFDITGTGYNATDLPDLVLLGENVDGDFSNGGTVTVSQTSNNGTNTVTFSGITIVDGIYFTLAKELSGDVTSVTNGFWNNPATWDCTCVPTTANNVIMNHNVTLNASGECADISISGGNTLTFGGSGQLSFEGDATIDGSIDMSAGGSVDATGTSAQTFTNSSGSTISFHNLRNSNANGLTIETGAVEVINNLQVTAGVITMDGVNMTLVSNSSGTSNILQSVDGAFATLGGGSFTVQRFIGARNANYANISSPIEDADVADIDGELTLSGVGTGNAVTVGLTTFYSVWEYDASAVPSVHSFLSATSDLLRTGKGYEVYLASTVSSFSGATVTFDGLPNVGNTLVRSQDVFTGWNLLGNPYHCYVSYDDLDLGSDLANTFYIYNSSTGSYGTGFTQGSGQQIAPGQGFWVDKTSGATRAFDFEEADKVENHSSSFVRLGAKQNESMIFNIREKNSVYNQDLKIQFDAGGQKGIDEGDARYLPAPHKEIPALVSRAENSEKDLIVNTVDNLSPTHQIPLKLISGLDAEYQINVKHLDKVYEQYDCVFLKDKFEDQEIDLSVEPVYNFYSEEGEFERFELIVSNNYQDCQKTMEVSADVVQKLDDELKLRYNQNGWWMDYSFEANSDRQIEVRVYNLIGQSVISPSSVNVSGSGTISLRQLEQLDGIYIIQLISGEEIVTQRVQL